MSSTRAADRLAGKRAIVTGASRGIGLATARVLAGDGAQVALLARRHDALLEAAAALGDGALAVPCDVSNADALTRALSTIRTTFGGAPDIVVNNAGVFELDRIEDLEPAALSRALETNVAAPHRIVHEFLGDMRSRGSGHIVTIGSIADRQIFSQNGAYAASKHAARALHEVMRAELRGSGVRVTLISPGPVDTPLWDRIDPDHREGFTPRAFMLGADAVAAAVLYAVTQPQAVNVDELRLSRS
jgi:NADP-dependent 3-hydroxy acid dehydrogenase YdfG